MSPTSARILVVDDEKLIRWSVSERLARKGYEVATAESGEEALRHLGTEPTDLVILDVKLPGMDGVTALQQALSLRPGLAIVMMSAHSTVDLAVGAMKLGAHDFLVKPFPFRALDDAVDRALQAARTRQQVEHATLRTDGQRAESPLVGNSPTLARVRSLVERISASDATTVLIEGESGSGKDVVARAVHTGSARASRPFLQVNCAALPEQLLESELFGHERGSFTDARAQKRGLFEAAAGGTVMLDEIGDLPTAGQAKLLQLLESKHFRRVGGVDELQADVRVVAATNVDLDARVADGRFRTDLFFRLNVVRIRIPPLREHLEDVGVLVAHFIAHFNRVTGRSVRGVSPAGLELLAAHRWPGNVRELRNTVEQAFILDAGATELRPEHFPPEVMGGRHAPSAPAVEPLRAEMGLDAAERRLISDAMRSCEGNQSKAAKLLGITRDTLRYRLKKHGML